MPLSKKKSTSKDARLEKEKEELRKRYKEASSITKYIPDEEELERIARQSMQSRPRSKLFTQRK